MSGDELRALTETLRDQAEMKLVNLRPEMQAIVDDISDHHENREQAVIRVALLFCIGRAKEITSQDDEGSEG